MTRRETIRAGELWKRVSDSGLSEREIIALQPGHTRAELSRMWGVCEGRVTQIRARAKRKMCHPLRRELCDALGLTEKVGVYKIWGC